MLVVPSSFATSASHRALHSFPTRRSSDLHDGQSWSDVQLQSHRDEQRRLDRFEYEEHRRQQHHLPAGHAHRDGDRKSTRLNSSHLGISYAVFCLKKKTKKNTTNNKQHTTK